MDNNIKLSEAVKLGATMKPQAKGYFLSPSGGTCVGAAALDALGELTDNNTAQERIIKHWPIWNRPIGNYWEVLSLTAKKALMAALRRTEHGIQSTRIGDLIMTMNDDPNSHISREVVADVIETFEYFDEEKDRLVREEADRVFGTGDSGEKENHLNQNLRSREESDVEILVSMDK